MTTQVDLNLAGVIVEPQPAAVATATVVGTYYDLMTCADEEAGYVGYVRATNLDLTKYTISLYEYNTAASTRVKLVGPINIDKLKTAGNSFDMLLNKAHYLSAERKLQVRIEELVSGAAISAGVAFAASWTKWTPL